VQVTPLGPDDPSPFRIGRLDKGAAATVLETGGAIAAAAPHDPPAGFFLAARKPTGHVFLRALSGTFLVRAIEVFWPQRTCSQNPLASGSDSSSVVSAVHGCFSDSVLPTHAPDKLQSLQVGQQQPKVAVVAPASQAAREVEESRVVAHVHRALRKKQNALAKSGSGDARPSISRSVRCICCVCDAKRCLRRW
jgi:hypothetical protein